MVNFQKIINKKRSLKGSFFIYTALVLKLNNSIFTPHHYIYG